MSNILVTTDEPFNNGFNFTHTRQQQKLVHQFPKYGFSIIAASETWTWFKKTRNKHDSWIGIVLKKKGSGGVALLTRTTIKKWWKNCQQWWII